MLGYLLALAAFVLGVTLVLRVAMRRWLQRRSAEGPAPLGIVLLLERPKTLQSPTIADAFQSAVGKPFRVIPPVEGNRIGPSDLPDDNAVLGGPESFVVKAEGDLFMVHNVAKPYLAPSGMAEDETLRRQQAWLSIEILHPEAVSAANYRIVAQVSGALLDQDCLALFHPESGKLVPARAEETLEKLKTPHPIHSLFDVRPNFL